MQRFTLVAFVTSTLVTLVSSQAPVDPSSVDDQTKAKWCTDQKSSCPLLCLQVPGADGEPQDNSCEDSSLAFSCVCSNGQSPNSSEYSQTIPYYQCETAANNCVNNCNGDSNCQTQCRTANPCGAQNPTRVNTSTISSTMSATATGAGSTATGGDDFTGFGGSGASETGTNAAGRPVKPFVMEMGPLYGMVVLLAGVFGGFAFML